VGDDGNRGVEVTGEVGEQLQDLRLHGDVERRGRLVGESSAGSHSSAIAIMTRWRMPPENSCG
jgi:hypothetical protein